MTLPTRCTPGEFRCDDGNLYKCVPRDGIGDEPGAPSFGSTILALNDIADSLRRLVNVAVIDRWSGHYTAIELTVPENQINHEISNLTAGRMVSIRTDQTIKVRLNNIMNPEFTIERDEKQIALGPFPPESVVRSVFITTGTSETRIKILAFG